MTHPLSKALHEEADIFIQATHTVSGPAIAALMRQAADALNALTAQNVALAEALEICLGELVFYKGNRGETHGTIAARAVLSRRGDGAEPEYGIRSGDPESTGWKSP